MAIVLAIVGIVAVIYLISTANNKIKEARIEASPQYQIYLEVLKALKQDGYEIVGSKINNRTVQRGNETYGNVFVVIYSGVEII